MRRWKEAEYPAIAAEGAAIYFADEAGIRSDHHAGTTWAPVGQIRWSSHRGEVQREHDLRGPPEGEVASGIRCKSAGVVPGFMIRLGDGADSFGAAGGGAGGDGAWPQLGGWFEQ